MTRSQVLFLVCMLCYALHFLSRVEGSETTGTRPEVVVSPPRLAPEPKLTNPFAQFRKIKKLGAGSYGVTFEVVDSKGDHFALKVSHESDCTDEEFKTDAIQEYTIGYVLNHINIVRAHAFYLWDDKCAILMDLVKGESISKVWRRASRFKSQLRKELDKNNHILVWEIATKIASGIDEMCKNNFVHGDLSQNNVLFDKVSKQVTIVDLGAARKAPYDNYYRDLTETCTIVSPERRLKDFTVGPPHCSSDVFALCSITTYLLGTPIVTFDAKGCHYDRYDRLFAKSKSDPEIVDDVQKLFRISNAEAVLLKNMCHRKISKRSTPANLVEQLTGYLRDEHHKINIKPSPVAKRGKLTRFLSLFKQNPKKVEVEEKQ